MATTLAALHVYPVKGLKGIELKEARATERGLEHDRRFMVVDDEGVFLTQRDHPAMATIWTDIRFAEMHADAQSALGPHMTASIGRRCSRITRYPRYRDDRENAGVPALHQAACDLHL